MGFFQFPSSRSKYRRDSLGKESQPAIGSGTAPPIDPEVSTGMRGAASRRPESFRPLFWAALRLRTARLCGARPEFSFDDFPTQVAAILKSRLEGSEEYAFRSILVELDGERPGLFVEGEPQPGCGKVIEDHLAVQRHRRAVVMEHPGARGSRNGRRRGNRLGARLSWERCNRLWLRHARSGRSRGLRFGRRAVHRLGGFIGRRGSYLLRGRLRSRSWLRLLYGCGTAGNHRPMGVAIPDPCTRRDGEQRDNRTQRYP
jgi:hypothetical protein